MKSTINTWDFFDTLVARFLIEAHHIFALVEQRSGVEDYAKLRLQAQQLLDQIGRPYTIHQIYRCMEERLGVPTEVSRKLIALELNTEIEQLIPVQRQIDRVEAGDLIVSDMYLTADHVQDLMRCVCGMHVGRPPVVGNWGKASGSLWLQLAQHHLIRRHHGDNPQSDVANPEKLGIPCELISDTQLTPWEQRISELALPHLALLLREVRLRKMPWQANPLQTTVLGPYLTFLLCAALYIRQLALREPQRKLIFVSRDCCHLSHLFHRLCPEVESESLDLTRKLLQSGAADALFAARLTPDCLIIDMVASGASLNQFFTRSGIDRECLFFLYYDQLLSHQQKVARDQRMQNGKLQVVFRTTSFAHPHLNFEVLLDPGHPSVTGIASDDGSGALIKTFAADDHNRQERQQIAFINQCVSELANTVTRRGFPGTATMPQLEAGMQLALAAIVAENGLLWMYPSYVAREGRA